MKNYNVRYAGIFITHNGTEGGGPNILMCTYQKQIFQICMREIHDRIGKKKGMEYFICVSLILY